MALTINQALAVEAGHTYIYEYHVSVQPYKAKAQYKGQLSPRGNRWGQPEFKFFAPNDESALAYLLLVFQPDDPRPLQSVRMLAESRVRTWDTGDPAYVARSFGLQEDTPLEILRDRLVDAGRDPGILRSDRGPDAPASP